MTKNPFFNALAAGAYIIFVVLILNTVMKTESEDTIFIPMFMISMFVLSASVMAYVFLLQPVMLYLDGSKREAVDLFVKTVGVFACITVVFLAALLLLGPQT